MQTKRRAIEGASYAFLFKCTECSFLLAGLTQEADLKKSEFRFKYEISKRETPKTWVKKLVFPCHVNLEVTGSNPVLVNLTVSDLSHHSPASTASSGPFSMVIYVSKLIASGFWLHSRPTRYNIESHSKDTLV